MPLGRQDIDQAKSLRALAGGQLPIRAQLRLKEEAGPDKKLFTSDLSVNEFLLARESECQPISQVMGSSIYHIGKIADYKGKTGEITTLSSAHRQARQLALSRIKLEAQAVNADAVIGVRLGERLITKGSHGKGGDDGDEIIEFTVVGTAVKVPRLAHALNPPVLTDLSGQDFWALAREGYVPCGLVFDFCRYHVWHVMAAGNWTAQGEIKSASDAVDEARLIVQRRVLDHARDTGAEFIVGSDIKVDVHEVPCGYHECKLNDLDIDVSWFGTGVRHMGTAARCTTPNVPPLVLGMMKLGRKKRDILEGEEDESEELAKQAKEDEERALERDEKGGE